MALVRYSYQPDDALTTAATNPLDEDFGSWPSRLALVAATAASLVAVPVQAHTADDEIVTTAATVVVEDDYQPPQPSALRWFARALGVDDDPAGSLTGQPDEDFWQNPVAPVQARNYVRLPLGDSDGEIPAGSLFGAPDLDEVWRNPVAPVAASNRVPPPIDDMDELPAGSFFGEDDEDFPGPLPRPIVATNYQPLPYAWGSSDDDAPPPLYGVPEEDSTPPARVYAPAYALVRASTDDDAVFTQTIVDEDPWAQLVLQPRTAPPVVAVLETDEPPAGFLTGQPDEDYWTNPVRPVPAANRVSLPWEPDLDEIPSGSLTGQPDEDFGPPLPAPVPPRNRVSLPLGDQDSETPLLTGQMDEDFWANPVRPVVASNRVSLPWEPELDELPTTLFGTLDADDDAWRNPVAPVVASLGRLYLPDPESETPPLYGQPDEDLAGPLPKPVPPSSLVLLPYNPDQDGDIPAGFLYGQPDEDFWVSGVPPVPPSSHVVLPLGDPDSETPLLYGVPEEDAFQPRPPAPPAQVRPVVDGDDAALAYQVDEDYWSQAVQKFPAPPPTVFTDALEWVPFVATTTVEDEPWFPPVARPTNNYQARPFVPDEDEDVPRLFGTAEEEYWQNPVRPVPASNWQLLPTFYGETEDVPPLSGTPDLDETWRNWVAPVPATNYQPLPYVWGNTVDDDAPAGSLFGMPDEDFPGPLPRPVPPSNLVLLPYNPDPTQDVPRLYGVLEEDQYRAPVLPWPPLPPKAFSDDETWTTYLVEDEPYFAPVKRPDGTFQARPYEYGQTDDDNPSRLYGVPEEDRYSAPIPPPPPLVRATLVDDEITIPAVDEDFPGPLPAPVPGRHGRLYLPEPDGDIPAGELTGQPDEDFPGPFPAPVQASSYQRLPYLEDYSEQWVPFVSVEIVEDEPYLPPAPWPQHVPPNAIRLMSGVDDDAATRLFRKALSVSYGTFPRRWKRDPVPYRMPPGGNPGNSNNDNNCGC